MDHPRAAGPLPALAGETAVILDYCFKREETDALLAASAGRLLVLDHHASAERELAGVPDANKVFAMGQSGATLSWDFFFPGEPAPLWLRYVEDKDIWRWALRDSAAFTAGFSMVPLTFDAYAALHAGGERAVDALIAKGESVLEYRNSVVAAHVRRAVPAALRVAPAGLAGAHVNCSTLASEVGNAVCVAMRVDYAIIWSYDGAKKEFYVSLRSVDGERADVSAIAKTFGGGGHKCAAGFSWKGASVEELFV
jgi:oligoribonuclease NrnB/cAMP/cGMP phosphodiesterase (DHH superfamily)